MEARLVVVAGRVVLEQELLFQLQAEVLTQSQLAREALAATQAVVEVEAARVELHTQEQILHLALLLLQVAAVVLVKVGMVTQEDQAVGVLQTRAMLLAMLAILLQLHPHKEIAEVMELLAPTQGPEAVAALLPQATLALLTPDLVGQAAQV